MEKEIEDVVGAIKSAARWERAERILTYLFFGVFILGIIVVIIGWPNAFPEFPPLAIAIAAILAIALFILRRATRATASGKQADSGDDKHMTISKEWREVILLSGVGVCIATWVLCFKAFRIGFFLKYNIFWTAFFETIFVGLVGIEYMKKMRFTWSFRKKLL